MNSGNIRKLCTIMMLVVVASMLTPSPAHANSRLDKARLAIPKDILSGQDVPNCARQMWSSDVARVFAIEQPTLLSCTADVMFANDRRRNFEQQIVAFRREVQAQRQRVVRNPPYVLRQADLEVIDQLWKDSTCGGGFWQSYIEFMADFIKEHDRLSSIVRVRTESPLPRIDPPCRT